MLSRTSSNASSNASSRATTYPDALNTKFANMTTSDDHATTSNTAEDLFEGYDADAEIGLFKAHFNKHVTESAKYRTCDNTVSQVNRRLDSLARLLEQKSMCVAIVYDPESKRILITSNSIQPSALQKNSPKEDIRNIQVAMELLANHSASVEKVINGLAMILDNYIRRNETVRRILSVHEKIPANRQMRQVIGLLIKDSFLTGIETKIWKNQFNIGMFCEQYKIQLTLATRVLLINKIEMKHIINDVSRIVRDFVKLRNSLAEISGCRSYKILGIPDGTHAEMGMIDNLPVVAPHIKAPYIGISRLCCASCGLGAEVSAASVRGKHGQAFDSNIPAFILHDPVKLEAFLGKEAYAEYMRLGKLGHSEKTIEYAQTIKGLTGKKDASKKPRTMIADSSDSDVALGVSDSDDEIKDMLDDMTVSDIQLLKTIKYEYNNEFENLKSIGLSKSGIIDLYRESEDKFVEMASDEIVNLILDMDIDVSFDELSTIYDDKDPASKMIFAEIQDRINYDSIRGEYAFAAFCDTYRAEYDKFYDSDGDLRDPEECYEVDIAAIVRARLEKEDGADSYENSENEKESGYSDG